MYQACIVLADASRARLFQFERTAAPEGLHDQLSELSDLVNPGRRLRPSELFSDSGLGANHTGQHGYSFDDHRDDHVAQMDAEFAQSIAAEVMRLAVGVDRVIICASPRMLGQLREALGTVRRPGLTVDEVPRDLVKLTPPQIRDQLTSYGLLPSQPPRRAFSGRA